MGFFNFGKTEKAPNKQLDDRLARIATPSQKPAGGFLNSNRTPGDFLNSNRSAGDFLGNQVKKNKKGGFQL